MKCILIYLMLISCGITSSFSQILRLPGFFSDNMVLQQKAEVKIWGWAKSGQKVSIVPSWSSDTIVTMTSGDARWRTSIETPVAGGPYNIEFISQNQHKVLENVLIGEVWLVAGQSNMQWSAQSKLKEMQDILSDIANPNIRFLEISNIASQTPQDNIFDTWATCTPESAASFSAIGYFFAEKLQNELDVPIGIINASWGGSSAEFWTPKEAIDQDPELKKYADMQTIAPRKPYQPGVLWNSMLFPFAGYVIKGALWYQGEDNTISYGGYDKLIKTMVGSWRKAWQADFPFYFVQIAPYTYKYETPNGALLREQQSLTASTLLKSGMVVTTDLTPDVKNIHPTKKKDVALRLASLALNKDYSRNNTDYQSPVYKDHQVEGNKIRIRFANLTGNLKVEGKDIKELYIAGKDQQFYSAKHKLSGNELIVFSSKVKKPVAVRFGFSDTAIPNLFNEKGLPVAPFRTDSWANFK